MNTFLLKLNVIKTYTYFILSLLFILFSQHSVNAADPQKGFAFDAELEKYYGTGNNDNSWIKF